MARSQRVTKNTDLVRRMKTQLKEARKQIKAIDAFISELREARVQLSNALLKEKVK